MAMRVHGGAKDVSGISRESIPSVFGSENATISVTGVVAYGDDPGRDMSSAWQNRA